jgi:hypothetical protein
VKYLRKKQSTSKVQEVAKAAAMEVLKQLKEEERQRIKKTRYHNTELLLKNYLNLLDHYENAKEKASDVIELDDIEAEEIIIKAIKRSRIRTAIMINQIETCLKVLRLRMEGKGQSEKYDVIDYLYLDKARRDIERGKLMEVIAQELNCSQKSIYRWKNEMISELSILLFGVDGLKLDL